ncbi:MAG TPA: AAA family ATPase, partial [Kofleriaceae bacterium]|nr:AAA family ATPase [Kofleriaceae bacterium]
MRGEYVDDEIERQLHDGFTGRGDLLDELDRLVIRDASDRCVVLRGGSGMGKTAIVTRWLLRREASHDPVFHHFIRRQRGDRAEPWLIARALAAQIENRFPHLRDPFARPEARLSDLVTRAVRELAPHRRRLVLVIDGLGERTSGSDLRDVMACLPRAQPGGLRLVLAGRLRDPERDLEGRYGQVVALDLDDPGFAADNEATVRAYWTREAGALALDAGLAEHAVRCARGNMLHAALLRKHLARLPQPEHCSDAIPRDLPALLAKLWQRVEGAPAALRALEILCAAREPLSLEQIGRVAGWTDPGDLRAVANLARELVVEIRRDDRTTVYGIFHDAVRSFAIERLGPIAIRGQHRELADKLATWPAPRDPATRRYALRYAVGHRIAAGDCRAVHALASDLAFLEAKCSELGIDEAELDVRRSADACLAAGQMTLHADLDRLVRSIASESSSLPRDAGPDAAPLWGRVRKGQPAAEQAAAAPAPASAAGSAAPPEVGRTALLRGRPGVLSALIGRAAAGALDPAAVSAPAGATATGRTLSQPGRPAQLAALVGRGGGVTACAVTPDSRRVVAAYADHSLKLWDLETGRVVRTMTGHTGAIASCAITPDGRWTVSASADTTLRVWDL